MDIHGFLQRDSQLSIDVLTNTVACYGIVVTRCNNVAAKECLFKYYDNTGFTISEWFYI